MTAGDREKSGPVRVTTDSRVVWYPSGKVGVGPRRARRCKTPAAAAAFAAKLRVELEGAHGAAAASGGDPTAPLDVVMAAFSAHLRASSAKMGTLRQYESNWRTWVPSEVRDTPCIDLTLAQWTTTFDRLVYASAHPRTITSVARTLGSLITFGMRRGYFVREPFAAARLRRDVVREAVAAVRGGDTTRIRPADCPSLPEVLAFAEAFELQYPGYGRRLVIVAFASGLRLCELLALRVEDVHALTGELSVTKQLDRYSPWPATRPPKSDRPRMAIYWAVYAAEVASLVADARTREADNGWLFPRHRSVTMWADQVGRFARAAGDDVPEWRWSFHWLRHAHASVSMAPVEMGGYGLDPKSVSEWLGHATLSTTLDMYVARFSDDVAQAKALTGRPPGSL